MFVRDCMTANPITITKEISELCKERGINIRSLATFEREPGVYHLTFRLRVRKPRSSKRIWKKTGYKVISVS